MNFKHRSHEFSICGSNCSSSSSNSSGIYWIIFLSVSAVRDMNRKNNRSVLLLCYVAETLCMCFGWQRRQHRLLPQVLITSVRHSTVYTHGCGFWRFRVPDPLKICRRGQSMFWPLKCHILSLKTVVKLSTSFTSSTMKNLRSKM